MLRTLLIAVVLLALLVSLAGNVSASSTGKGAIVIHFDMEVDQGSANYVQKAASGAISSGYDMVIVMNTPGGELADMITIVDAIQSVEAHGLQVYTYVPQDGLAASAGSYIALATNRIYMANGSFIGPSTPYVVGGSASEQQHVQNAMVAYMRSLAQENHYNVTAAVNMAENNTAYAAITASTIGLVTGMAQNLSVFLSDVGLQPTELHNYSEPVYDSFLSFLSNSTVDGLFILIGFIAAAIDLLHRTVILTAVAAVLIALGFLGAEAVGAPVVAILLLVVAAVLIFIEIKVGHGLFVTAGVAVGLVGVWLLAGNAEGYSPSPVGVTTFLGYAIVGGLLIVAFIYLAKLREAIMRQPKAIDYNRLSGREGIALTDILPGKPGVCNVSSEDWTCISDTPISKGTRIRVVDFNEGRLKVEESR
ncbi:MAG: NfeD family protein [Methanomassiliicoccales archaeon]